MIDKTNDTNDSLLRYRSPEVKVIEVNVRGVLCQSDGNDSMREHDYGNAGFEEE